MSASHMSADGTPDTFDRTQECVYKLRLQDLPRDLFLYTRFFNSSVLFYTLVQLLVSIITKTSN